MGQPLHNSQVLYRRHQPRLSSGIEYYGIMFALPQAPWGPGVVTGGACALPAYISPMKLEGVFATIWVFCRFRWPG